jgi:hypothetical protein
MNPATFFAAFQIAVDAGIVSFGRLSVSIRRL